jgi:hypothetical protein
MLHSKVLTTQEALKLEEQLNKFLQSVDEGFKYIVTSIPKYN